MHVLAALAFCFLFSSHGHTGEVSEDVGRGEVVGRERKEEEEVVEVGEKTEGVGSGQMLATHKLVGTAGEVSGGVYRE